MKAVVDTCGWIEWLTNGPLANQYQPYLQDLTALVIPTVIQFELYKWTRRNRGEKEAAKAVGLTGHGKVIPLETSLALYAGDLALEHKLSVADAVIYASARQANVPLVSSDDHFENLPGVIYFSKKDL
jgi:predicted nucleic acid-binding protein